MVGWEERVGCITFLRACEEIVDKIVTKSALGVSICIIDFVRRKSPHNLAYPFFFFSPRPQISFQILFSFYTCFRSSFLEVPWPKLFCYYLANYNLFSIFELRIYFLAILVSNLVDIRTKIFSEIFRSRNLQKILLLGNFQDSFCFLFAVGTTLPTTLA